MRSEPEKMERRREATRLKVGHRVEVAKRGRGNCPSQYSIHALEPAVVTRGEKYFECPHPAGPKLARTVVLDEARVT
jgi:hypothetical protein